MVLVKFHRAVRERKRGEERERDRSLYFLHHILLRVKYNLLSCRSIVSKNWNFVLATRAYIRGYI